MTTVDSSNNIYIYMEIGNKKLFQQIGGKN
ncbi:hypothetical protein GvMRE_Ic3g69 [endosymbiont GvMRE of Glomus versiforme]|nr:hypothetical protein GvMRE_Ic3g69 [endosymbiont GvMRE of Glomus versiforme]